MEQGDTVGTYSCACAQVSPLPLCANMLPYEMPGAQRGFSHQNPSTGWCKVPPAVPFPLAVPFSPAVQLRTRIYARMKPRLGRDSSVLCLELRPCPCPVRLNACDWDASVFGCVRVGRAHRVSCTHRTAPRVSRTHRTLHTPHTRRTHRASLRRARPRRIKHYTRRNLCKSTQKH